ncbi:ribonuclease HI [Chelatococcus asaccharovorans]
MILVYTDGACLGNPGPGGYAALVLTGGAERIISGGDPCTTNNKMEMTAAIQALQALPVGSHVTVHSDSQYLVKGITEWLPTWKRRGWRTGDKKPVLNQPLWEHLEGLVAERTVTWSWVRGHAGHEENERVDGVANAEAEKARDDNSSRRSRADIGQGARLA